MKYTISFILIIISFFSRSEIILTNITNVTNISTNSSVIKVAQPIQSGISSVEINQIEIKLNSPVQKINIYDDSSNSPSNNVIATFIPNLPFSQPDNYIFTGHTNLSANTKYWLSAEFTQPSGNTMLLTADYSFTSNPNTNGLQLLSGIFQQTQPNQWNRLFGNMLLTLTYTPPKKVVETVPNGSQSTLIGLLFILLILGVRNARHR